MAPWAEATLWRGRPATASHSGVPPALVGNGVPRRHLAVEVEKGRLPHVGVDVAGVVDGSGDRGELVDDGAEQSRAPAELCGEVVDETVDPGGLPDPAGARVGVEAWRRTRTPSATSHEALPLSTVDQPYGSTSPPTVAPETTQWAPSKLTMTSGSTATGGAVGAPSGPAVNVWQPTE